MSDFPKSRAALAAARQQTGRSAGGGSHAARPPGHQTSAGARRPPRQKERELALSALYQKEYHPKGSLEGIFLASNPDRKEEGEESFALQLLKGLASCKAAIDSRLEKAGSGWSLQRMSLMDLSILRLAAFEILYRPDIPKAASISSALLLAKKFSSNESAAFVNGVLDSIPKGGASSAGKPAPAAPCGSGPQADAPTDRNRPLRRQTSSP